jgi:hypothetical protein
MKRIAFLALSFLFLILITTCAKEQSQEERLREQDTRKLARLSKAAGEYRGFLTESANQIVPINLIVSVQANPVNGEDEPVLQGSLRIGLFGGVQIASSAGSFDWGIGKISFAFQRSSAAGSSKALEVRAFFKDGILSQAVLDAPRQGVFPLDLKRQGVQLFTNDKEFKFAWNTPGSLVNPDPICMDVVPDSLLTINLRPQSFPAPGNLDLPYVPGLNATMQFSPLAQAPETATTVIYDPIGGTMDLYFTPVSLLHFDNLFLSSPSDALSLESLSGFLSHGSVQTAQIKVIQTTKSNPVVIAPLPQRKYRGLYYAGGAEIRAEVNFEYLKAQLFNTDNLPFPAFPKISLELVKCIGTKAERRDTLNLVSVDHMNGVASFQMVPSPNPVDLDLVYSVNWDSLDGLFLQGSGVGSPRPRLSITPRTFDGPECADDPGV